MIYLAPSVKRFSEIIIVIASMLLLSIGQSGYCFARQESMERSPYRSAKHEVPWASVMARWTEPWRVSLWNRTVIVFDRQYFHDEVHGPLLDCLGQFENTKIIVYRQEWRWRFGQLLRGSYPLRSPKNLVRDLQHDPALAGPIDLIFGTCDLDLVWMSDALDAIWRARAAENRFRIVCIRHWPGEDLVRDNAHWLDRAAFTVLGGSKSKKLKTMLTGLDRFGRSHDSLDAGASAIPGRTTGPTLVAPSE